MTVITQAPTVAVMPGGLTTADLRCPATGAPLSLRDGALVAVGVVPERVYPIVGGVPVLIDDDTSLFCVADFMAAEGGGTALPGTIRPEEKANPLKVAARALMRCLPDRSYNISDFSARQALDAVAAEVPDARVLVIGAGEATLPDAARGCKWSIRMSPSVPMSITSATPTSFPLPTAALTRWCAVPCWSMFWSRTPASPRSTVCCVKMVAFTP